jgi:nucleotide-binding universal stress UspA family protein
MNNILVPTDFSENADNAMDYAIALAKQTNRSIHLIHTYTTTSHAGHLSNINRIIREDRDKEMKAYITKKEKEIGGTVTIGGRVRKGDAIVAIEEEVEKCGANLIVMGTQGANSVSKRVLGSTASNVIKQANLPVLAIPAAVKYSNFTNLVVALDALNIPQEKALNKMIAFAKTMEVEINLIHVTETGKAHTTSDPKVGAYLLEKEVEHTYENIEGANVMQGILDYVDQKENAILCLIARERGWFSNLFHQSVSTGVAKEATLPLLVLHDGEGE